MKNVLQALIWTAVCIGGAAHAAKAVERFAAGIVHGDAATRTAFNFPKITYGNDRCADESASSIAPVITA